jgi:hypothetical protein
MENTTVETARKILKVTLDEMAIAHLLADSPQEQLDALCGLPNIHDTFKGYIMVGDGTALRAYNEIRDYLHEFVKNPRTEQVKPAFYDKYVTGCEHVLKKLSYH